MEWAHEKLYSSSKIRFFCFPSLLHSQLLRHSTSSRTCLTKINIIGFLRIWLPFSFNHCHIPGDPEFWYSHFLSNQTPMEWNCGSRSHMRWGGLCSLTTLVDLVTLGDGWQCYFGLPISQINCMLPILRHFLYVVLLSLHNVFLLRTQTVWYFALLVARSHAHLDTSLFSLKMVLCCDLQKYNWHEYML